MAAHPVPPLSDSDSTVAARGGKGLVCLVDDDADIRASLSALLDLLGYQVATFADPVAFLRQKPIGGPAVVLLDVRLPTMSGVSLRDHLVENGVAHPIVFMSGECAAQEIVDAMKGGAVDFLLKPFTREDLEAALGAAMQQAREQARTERDRTSFAAGLAMLSPREHDVLTLMLKGYQNRQISEKLSIQADTVKKYRAAICGKFAVEDTVGLIELAEASGARGPLNAPAPLPIADAAAAEHGG